MLKIKKIFSKLKNSFKEERGLLESGEVLQKNFSTTVAFKYLANLPIIEVEIDAQKYKFLFDTAALSVVPTKLIKSNLLKPLESIEISDSQNTLSDKNLYTLSSLKLGGLEFCDFAVVTHDFDTELPLSCLEIDGIFGYNFLNALVTQIDYQNQEIHFFHKVPSTKGFTKLPLLFDGLSGPRFEINFAFRNILLTVDTGKNDGISLSVNDEFGSFNEYNYEMRETSGLFMSSFNGLKEYSKERNYLVKDFKITPKIEIESYPVSLNASSLSLVGNDFLQNFDMILDFREKKLYLKKHSEAILKRKFYKSFGFFMHWSEKEKLYISALTEGLSAQCAGLEIGDRILALGERDSYDLSSKEYCQIFLELNSSLSSSKEELEITVKNDTTIKRVILKRNTIDEI